MEAQLGPGPQLKAAQLKDPTFLTDTGSNTVMIQKATPHPQFAFTQNLQMRLCLEMEPLQM
jgi:hypothetical protein